MAESNLAIKITADTTSANANLALANANVRAFSSELNSLAKQAVAGGAAMRAELLPQIESTASLLANAKVEAAAYRAELTATTSHVGRLGESIRLSGEHLDRLSLQLREYTSVFSSFGELVLVGLGAERLLGVVDRVVDLGEELNKLSKTTGVSVETLSGWRYAADQMGVSSQSLDTALVRLGRNVQTALFTPTSQAAKAFELLGLSQDYLRAHSNDLVAILMKMAEAFHSHADGANAEALAMETMGRGGAELIPLLREGSDAIQQMTERQRALGGQMSGPMAEAMERHRQAVKDLDTAWLGLAMRLTDRVGPALMFVIRVLSELMAADPVQAQINGIESLIERLNADLVMLKKGAAGDSGLMKWFDERQIAATENQIELLSKKLADLKQKASAAPAALSAAAVPEAPEAPKPAFGNLESSTGQATALEKFRETLAEMQADWDGTRRSMLAKSAEMWRQETEDASLSAKEKLEAEKGYAAARRALRQEALNEDRAIARNDADTDLAISRIQIQAKKNALDAELQAHRVNATQKLEGLRKLTDDEFALDLKALENERAALATQPVEAERVYNQIRQLKAKQVADMAALDRQAALDARKSADDQAKAWKDAANEIGNVEQRLVSGILSGRQSLAQSLIAVANDLVTREIANDLRYYSMKTLYGALGLAEEQKNANGGLLVHLLAEQTKTAATVAGETARTTAQAAGAISSAATTAVAAKGEIGTHAASAAAAVYDDVAQIPVVGWVLAPPAAAVAWAAVEAFGGLIPSFAVGTPYVPADTLAVIHQGERVMTASDNASFTSALAGAGAGAESGGGQQVVFNYSPVVQALDQTGIDAVLRRHGLQIARAVAAQWRDNPSVPPRSP